jgi:diaminohydroxyphosphoribosylaminopyrimidine deaminase / 5-amino-6-(5-phosphoribosylamino)uracil reductase
MDDVGHMRVALGLARRGLGRVAPNPAVGCVLVRDRIVVGRGWTQPGGRPHAETEALRRAGGAAAGAVAYVTLEPCAHHGSTPPCVDALIAAGVARVVVAIEDPDPRVAGRGIDRLRAAGIAVEVGLCGGEAQALNAGFLKRIEQDLPLVTLKLATTLDGKIATHTGESRWITGEPARNLGHMLRRRHDAVMVGSGTVLADDPELTVRLPGLTDPPPLRIVVDGRLRTPLTAKLVAGAATVPTLIITHAHGDELRAQAFRDCGVTLVEVGRDAGGNVDLKAALAALAQRGITRILVEGGATLAASLLAARLVDRLAWFRSPGLIGGDGMDAVKPFGVDRLADQALGTRLSVMRLGQDLLETFDLNA